MYLRIANLSSLFAMSNLTVLFKLETLKSQTSVTVSVEKPLNQNFVSELRLDLKMF